MRVLCPLPTDPQDGWAQGLRGGVWRQETNPEGLPRGGSAGPADTTPVSGRGSSPVELYLWKSLGRQLATRVVLCQPRAQSARPHPVTSLGNENETRRAFLCV